MTDLCLLVNELAPALVDGCKEGEDNGEDQQWLSLGQGNASFETYLSEWSLACDSFSEKSSSKAKLCHPSNEKLVLLQQWED